MKAPRAHRIGAVLFGLWGVLHVVGGGALLFAWSSRGSGELMRSYGSTVAADIGDDLPSIVGAVGAFHAFNLLWIGALVLWVAITLNWKNRPEGLWLNVAMAGAADLGLVLFLLTPGYMTWGEGAPGLALFAPAVVFALLGRRASVTP